jgi:hypothetical protein
MVESGLELDGVTPPAGLLEETEGVTPPAGLLEEPVPIGAVPRGLDELGVIAPAGLLEEPLEEQGMV